MEVLNDSNGLLFGNGRSPAVRPDFIKLSASDPGRVSNAALTTRPFCPIRVCTLEAAGARLTVLRRPCAWQANELMPTFMSRRNLRARRWLCFRTHPPTDQRVQTWAVLGFLPDKPLQPALCKRIGQEMPEQAFLLRVLQRAGADHVGPAIQRKGRSVPDHLSAMLLGGTHAVAKFPCVLFTFPLYIFLLESVHFKAQGLLPFGPFPVLI